MAVLGHGLEEGKLAGLTPAASICEPSPKAPREISVAAIPRVLISYRWSHPDHRMDHLHQAVAPMVDEATRAEEDSAITFYRVRALASAAHGNRMPAVAFPALSGQRKRPPRLTELWFC